MPPIVIAGTGLAGYSVAREFRKLDQETPLFLITTDGGCYYSKPMLSSAFTNGKTPQDLMLAAAGKMAEDLNASIRTQTTISALIPGESSIRLGSETLEYGKLVLAIGADPIRVPVAGDAQNAVLSVNDLEDYARFRQAIATAKRIAIMGAGLIGCEFANDLHAAGINVDLIDPADYALNRFLPPEAGHALQDALSGLGVAWHMQRVVERVDRDAKGLNVTLSDKSEHRADAVLSAIGLRPRTELARQAGLVTNRGIVVDRYLQSSKPNIYALGDCAEVEGLVLPFVMPIMHAARALARTLAFQPSPVSYPAMPVVVKTSAYPVVVSPPLPGVSGRWESTGVNGGIKSCFYDEHNVLQGFALTGGAVAEKAALAKQAPALLV